MNKFNVLVLLSLLSFSNLLAQSIDELYEDPDVVWMIATSEVFPLETPKYPVDTTVFNNINITKYQRKKTPHYNEDNLMTAQILAAMRAGELEILDADENIITGEAIQEELSYPYQKVNTSPSNDTVVPAGRAEYVPDDILDYEIQMVWYYNKKDKKIQSIVTGWQPLIRDWDWYEEGKWGEYSMITDVQQSVEFPRLDLSSEDVNYALTCHYNLDFKDAKVIKGRLQPFLQKIFFKDILENKRPTYKYSWDGLLTKAELKQRLKEGRDTIITFDPETYNESMTVISYERFDIEKSSNFRVAQVIYFDNKHKKLCAKLLSLGPLRNSIMEQGEGRWYRRPYFYIKFE